MAGLNERDELNEPLGLAAARSRRPISYGRLALAACAALALGLGVFLAETDDHLGGEPYAVASVELHPFVPPAAPAAPAIQNPSANTNAAAGPFGAASASQVEMSSGVKVVRAGGGQAPGSLIITVPEAIGLHLTPA